MPLSVKTVELRPADRDACEVLARGYKEFYATLTCDADYAAAWERVLAQDALRGLTPAVDPLQS